MSRTKKIQEKVRVRFAPSPTGMLHIGGLRTALYNYLFARQSKGKLILRIEDTDRARLVPGALENILEVLKQAGLEYDEGPYFQSKRLDLYRKFAAELIKKENAYYCFCSPEELEKMRQEQMLKRQPTKYDGRCLKLDKKEIERRIKNKTPYVIRLKVPEAGETKFFDILRGEVSFKNELIDHQILLKADGWPTYHLANIVDDYLMKITYVIRGEEWLSSTPKHILLYRAFGWKEPQFAHLPLLLNPDRSKLSKRQGDVAATDYLKSGYLPEALLNFIALLGWNPSASQEVYSLKELIKNFDLRAVNKSGAVFNIEKLDWLNGFYIRKMPIKKLVKMCLPYLKASGFLSGEEKTAWLEKVVAVEQERMKKLSEIGELTEFFFKDADYDANLLTWKKADKKVIETNLSALAKFLTGFSEKDFQEKKLEKKIGEFIASRGLGTGETLWPRRVALTGRSASPGPFAVAEILGKKKTLERLNAAINKL